MKRYTVISAPRRMLRDMHLYELVERACCRLCCHWSAPVPGVDVGDCSEFKIVTIASQGCILFEIGGIAQNGPWKEKK